MSFARSYPLPSKIIHKFSACGLAVDKFWKRVFNGRSDRLLRCGKQFCTPVENVITRHNNNYYLSMKLLYCLLREKKLQKKIPIWFMRQAGRYLPEYREVRKKYDDFLKFVGNPKDAAAVTLQPLERYDLDAAIIFSDILVVPHALGQPVAFQKGEGPQLTPIVSAKELKKLTLKNFKSLVTPTLEALELVSKKLGKTKTLIGFAGAPWTVMAYMLEGRGSKDFLKARQYLYKDPEMTAALRDLLVEATIEYLSAQIKAGADVIQIFDSWISDLPAPFFKEYGLKPVQKIISAIRAQHPDVGIIYFPRGAGERYFHMTEIQGLDGVSIDAAVDPKFIKMSLGGLVVQGGLDPAVLLGEPKKYDPGPVEHYLKIFAETPYIFNIGHGISQETDPAIIERIIQTVRDYENKGAENSRRTV